MKINRKRIIIISASLVFVAFGLFAGFGIYQGYKVQQMFIDGVHRREAAFRQEPTLISSLVLMNNYYWDLKQYDKANYYADYCIKLNVDKTRRGWFVHMVKAELAAKNKNLDEACNHLNLALQLAKQFDIPETNFNDFEYQELLNSCTAKGVK